MARGARFGYVIRGLLYGAMGWLAIALAWGAGVRTTDQSGVLAASVRSPLAVLIVTLVIVGLGAYSVWGFARAVYDPLGRGDGPTGIGARIGFAWSGLNYAILCVFAAGLAVGTSRSDDHSVAHLINRVMPLPSGRWLVMAAGLIGLGGGIAQFVDAYRAPFQRDVKRTTMTRAEIAFAGVVGRIGMVARGIVFTLMAWFILLAGINADPYQAQGIGGVFQALRGAPFGGPLLALTGFGFVALAVHSLFSARWVRMPGDKKS